MTKPPLRNDSSAAYLIASYRSQARGLRRFFIGADEDKIRVCGNTEASVTGFGFQLISQISGVIVQEFCVASIGCAALQATRCCCQFDILEFVMLLSAVIYLIVVRVRELSYL